MYSGIVLSRNSGRLLGVHQKIDRSAHNALAKATGLKHFPEKQSIINFEGKNGPDGIKVKSPAKDEPWHYVDPFDPDDIGLIEIINNHVENLTEELKDGNNVRAAFEASWLAHAITDGLTPAHHYPYEQELERLRGGAPKETRTTYKEKLLAGGSNPSERLWNNWGLWGFKGLIMSHSTFELGVAAIAAPLVFRQVELNQQHLTEVMRIGFEEHYRRKLREVALWHMYDEFMKYGWTWSLSKQTRDDLMPLIIETVATAWYITLKRAGLVTRSTK